MEHQNKAVAALKSIAIAIALPAVVFVVMELLLFMSHGQHIIRSSLDVKNLIRSSGISAAISFALSMNLSCGRMDLSLGAQRVAGTILGGLIAQALGLGGIWFLVFAVVFGMLFGTIVGLAFVTLRVPAMVLGIGMACILECIGFASSKGVGLRLMSFEGVTLLSDVNFTITVIVIMTVLMLALMTYTPFSYHFRAGRGSQYIARNAGINVFANVVICYTLAGGLVCVAGVLDGAYVGSVSATMGLGSTGSVMANMFPMMIGGMFLSRYINQAVGIVSASVALKIFSMGLSSFNVSEAVSSCINMALFIGFLVWLFNSNALKQARQDRERIAEAKRIRKEREEIPTVS